MNIKFSSITNGTDRVLEIVRELSKLVEHYSRVIGWCQRLPRSTINFSRVLKIDPKSFAKVKELSANIKNCSLR